MGCKSYPKVRQESPLFHIYLNDCAAAVFTSYRRLHLASNSKRVGHLKKTAFIRNALILTGTSLLLSSVGIYFRIYVSNKIGAEGMGLYQLTTSIYILAATFATSGISTAVTRLVSEESAKGGDVRKILRRCFGLAALFGIGAEILLIASADWIGNSWIGDARTILSLKAMALDLPFLSLSSCFNGYFFAKRKALKSASAQIFEQLVLIIILVNIIGTFVPKGLEYGCLAVVIAAAAAEMIACGYSFVLYLIERRSDRPGKNQKGILTKIMGITLPVAASSYLRSALITIENILIPTKLTASGQSRDTSLSQFGMIKGMVMPILFFPSAFIFAFSRLLIPEIAEANALGSKDKLKSAISRIFQFTLLISIIVAAIFLFFSGELSQAIYNDRQVGFLIKTLAPLIPLMYLDNIVDAMLKGLNEQVHSLKINVFDSVIRIILIYFIVPLLGMKGFIIVLYVSNILNPMLSILRLVTVVKLRVQFADWITKPILAAATAGAVVTTAMRMLSLPLNLTAAIALVIILYFVFLALMGSLKRQDAKWVRSMFSRRTQEG